MDVRFPFCNRDRELQDLIKARDRMTTHRNCEFFLIQGRRGIGKTALVRAFLQHNETDFSWHQRIGNADPRDLVIEFDCQQGSEKYLEPFKAIGSQISQRKAGTNILLRFLLLLVSWLPVYDIVDALEELKKEYGKHQDNESDAGSTGDGALIKKQSEVFGNYVTFIQKQSRKAPLFIYIRNVQWLDEHSMKLLNHLVQFGGFWGMIILEEGRVADGNPVVLAKLRRLTADHQLRRLQLLAMEKGFEKTVLGEVFGAGFFTESEYDMIYAVSDGVPGLLQHKVDNWLRSECIWHDGDRWRKHENFEIMIRDPLETMLDLVVTVSADAEIDARERMLLDTFAAIFGIDQDTISEMIAVVMGTTRLGYGIERRLRTGSSGKHALQASDPDGAAVILQYLPGAELDESLFVPRDVRHPHLMMTRNAHAVEGGVVLVYDYADGMSLVEMIKRRRSEQLRETYDTARALASGLAELHRNGFVHGSLRPDLVLCGADHQILVSGLDATRLGLSGTGDRRFLAPELWSGGDPTPAGDVFACGAIVYQMLTGELPYPDVVREGPARDSAFEAKLMLSDVPERFAELLKRCLRTNPLSRPKSGQDLLILLEEIDEDIDKFKLPEPAAPPATQPSAPPVPRWVRYATAAVFVLAVVAGIRFWPRHPDRNVDHKTVVVEDFDWQDGREHPDSRLQPEMLEYLILDSLSRSTDDYTILTPEQFADRSADADAVPEASLDVTVAAVGSGYSLECSLVSRSGDEVTQTLTIPVQDELTLIRSSLGETKVEEIVKTLLEMTGTGFTPAPPMTNDWSAFMDFYRGDAAWSRLDPTTAARALNSAIERDEDFILARLRLAQVHDWNGDRDLALLQMTAVTDNGERLRPEDRLQANALQARLSGQLSDAVGYLRELYNRRTTKESAYEVAEVYYEACDIPNAIQFYNIALGFDPDYAVALNHRGYCYAHLGRHDRALADFERYVELDSTANSFDSQGDGLMAAGRLAEAAEAKSQAITKDPSLAYIYESLCYIDALRGRFAAGKRDVDNYVAQSRENGNLTPRRQARAAYMRGLVDYLAGDPWSARVHCDEAIEFDDSDDLLERDHDLHWLRTLVHAEINDYDVVEVEFAHMDRLVRDNRLSTINYHMGLYKYWLHVKALRAAARGDAGEVKAIAQEFWSDDLNLRLRDHTSPIGPAFLNALMADLFLLEECDVPTEARACVDKALEYNPDHPLALHRERLVCERMGDAEGAAAARARLAQVWEGADEVVREIYGL